MNDLLASMPKVELHAHLNGCIRESTLLDLANERNVRLSPLLHELQKSEKNTRNGGDNISRVNTKQRSLQECFEIFSEISRCVIDLKALRRIAQEALQDFAEQNVVYLELRSTPKVLYHDSSKKEKATKKDYVDTILKVFEEFEESHCTTPMIPRFIISINRAESVKDAIENSTLAIEYKKNNNKYIVGLDLSGNPFKSEFKVFESAFTSVRKAGLKTSIHFGEIPCNDDDVDSLAIKDAKNILSFQPDRLGHSLLLTEAMFHTLDNIRIPVECCPTSNVMTLELAKHFEGDLVHGLRRHPRLKDWIDSEYPISINTDDPGIFNTNSTNELVLLAEAFEIKEPNIIKNIIEQSVEQIFESKEVKESLRELIKQRMQLLLDQYHDTLVN